ncbi:hypothetical protein BHM03_00050550 [Ensete ventricosum]|nr:hypothetical protein BHM03_00050550 [Ensete ventricosum]
MSLLRCCWEEETGAVEARKIFDEDSSLELQFSLRKGQGCRLCRASDKGRGKAVDQSSPQANEGEGEGEDVGSVVSVMDHLYKVMQVQGEPVSVCFKCQMREAVEMRSPMASAEFCRSRRCYWLSLVVRRRAQTPTRRWREEEAGLIGSRHCREQVR